MKGNSSAATSYSACACTPACMRDLWMRECCFDEDIWDICMMSACMRLLLLRAATLPRPSGSSQRLPFRCGCYFSTTRRACLMSAAVASSALGVLSSVQLAGCLCLLHPFRSPRFACRLAAPRRPAPATSTRPTPWPSRLGEQVRTQHTALYSHILKAAHADRLQEPVRRTGCPPWQWRTMQLCPQLTFAAVGESAPRAVVNAPGATHASR